jgi:hypothetical protein
LFPLAELVLGETVRNPVLFHLYLAADILERNNRLGRYSYGVEQISRMDFLRSSSCVSFILLAGEANAWSSRKIPRMKNHRIPNHYPGQLRPEF